MAPRARRGRARFPRPDDPMPILLVLLVLLAPQVAAAQGASPTGLEVAGLPVLDFDSDDGVGYGISAELYQYGEGGVEPYVWTLRPEVFLTTGGRRDVTLFLDAPHVLGGGWRFDVFAGVEKHVAAPYYGVGNETVRDEAFADEDGPNPRWYEYGRLRRSLVVDLQRSILGLPLRLLVGAGMAHVRVDPVVEDEGTTLYAEELGSQQHSYWSNFVRAGLVWDTRDRESAPSRGVWTEILLQRAEESLAADVGYTRWTFVDRRYFPLAGDRLVLAHRWLVQGVSGDAPVPELQVMESSFEPGEALGGAESVRGVLKNRFTGRGLLVWNAELRWRVLDVEAFGRSFHAALSAFLDQGRVWRGGVYLGQIFDDLHRGWGGGIHVGMGPNFVASLDLAGSRETSVQLYAGLGWLF